MTMYRNAVAQSEPDPAVVETLRAHEWDTRAKSCGCGWTQRASSPRGLERHNHPTHVAAAIACRVAATAQQ